MALFRVIDHCSIMCVIKVSFFKCVRKDKHSKLCWHECLSHKGKKLDHCLTIYTHTYTNIKV